MVKISILKSFRHKYGSKDIFLKEGAVYYLDPTKPEEKDELLHMMSSSFAYRAFISIESSPALLQALSLSTLLVSSVPPLNPREGMVYYNPLTKKVYFYNGTLWVELPGGSGGSGGGSGSGTPNIIPALFGDVSSSGFSNEVSINAGAVTNAEISANAGIELSKLAVNPLNRINHLGVQPASTILDFDPQVRTNRIDQLQSPVSDLNLANNKLVNVKDPVDAKDAVNKGYVDTKVSNLSLSDLMAPIGDITMAGYQLTNVGNPEDLLDAANKGYVDESAQRGAFKIPVRVVSTSNIALSGTQTIDARTVNVGDRVLVAGQADARLNGLYTVQAGAWVRTRDADNSDKLSNGVVTYVMDGGAFADTIWMMTSPNGLVVLGVSSLSFGQPGSIDAGDGLYRLGSTFHVGIEPNQLIAYADRIGISPNYAGQSSITTLGTITNGRWQGTPVDIAYGGTGASSAAQARTNLSAAKSGVNSDITQIIGLTTPLAINQGGTGANTAADARTSLQVAKSGVNNDITQLTGLTTPLSITQGGTGASDPISARANLQSAKSGANSDITSLTAAFTAPMRVDQGGTGATTAVDVRANLDLARTAVNRGAGAGVFINKNSNGDLGLRSINGASPVITTTESGETILIDLVPGLVDINDLGGLLNLAGSKVTGVLDIENGGTNGTTPTEALNNLGAIGTVMRSVGAIGTSLVGTRDGSNNSIQYMKGLVAGSDNLVITSSATDVTVDVNLAGLGINELSGVLGLNKGGTNATTATQGLKNLGGIGTVTSVGSGQSLSAGVDTAPAINTLRIKSIGAAVGSPVIVNSSATDVTVDVDESLININDLTGTLAINKGGTNAVTAGAALSNLGGVTTVTSVAGISLVSDITNSPSAGKTVELKGLQATSNNITILDSGDTLDLNVNEANLDLALMGGTLSIAQGGTGATTLAAAQLALGIPKTYTTAAPLSSAPSGTVGYNVVTVNHNLNLTSNQRLIVMVHDASTTGPGLEVENPSHVRYASANTLELFFASPGPTGSIHVSLVVAG